MDEAVRPLNHIVLTGPRANEIARTLFRMEAERGSHVLVDRPGGKQDNNLPERRLSAVDVLITLTQGNIK